MAVKTFKSFLDQLPMERKEKIRARADQLKAEMTLREIRKFQKCPQKAIAEHLHVNQSAISKMERRRDMNVSTLNAYIQAIGGELEFIVKLPNKKKVKINSLLDK